MRRCYLLFMILVLAIITALVLKEDSFYLLYSIFRSLIRMVGAYALTIIFSIFFGVLIAHNNNAFKVLFPLMDILQSIPILGFLPFAMLFLIDAVPFIGIEIVSVFLIFTSMTWSVLFNIVEGIKTIPDDLRDLSNLYRLKGFSYLFNVVFPAIYPALISGSIAGWAGAWYFLVVGEYFVFATQTYALPGIGSFIAQSAYSGHIIYSLLGIGILAAIVLSINQFVWQPLLFRARKYYYGRQETIGKDSNFVLDLERVYRKKIKRPLTENISLGAFSSRIFEMLNIEPTSKIEEEKSFGVFLFMVFILVGTLLFLTIYKSPGIIDLWDLLIYGGLTLIRISIAYILSLIISIGIGVMIGRSKNLLKIIMPLVDLGQSIPAVAVFPIIVVFVIKALGVELGIEVASIVLIMTGMVWYMIHNVIRAVRGIPLEILDISNILNLKRWHKIKHVIVPAIFPALIVGSVEGIGGGLNATIISEYIIYKDTIFSTYGLGYLMNLGAAVGSHTIILISVISMMLIVLMVNKLVWKNAINRIKRYTFG